LGRVVGSSLLGLRQELKTELPNRERDVLELRWLSVEVEPH
jgi:hypothetical protein